MLTHVSFDVNRSPEGNSGFTKSTLAAPHGPSRHWKSLSSEVCVPLSSPRHLGDIKGHSAFSILSYTKPQSFFQYLQIDKKHSAWIEKPSISNIWLGFFPDAFAAHKTCLLNHSCPLLAEEVVGRLSSLLVILISELQNDLEVATMYPSRHQRRLRAPHEQIRLQKLSTRILPGSFTFCPSLTSRLPSSSKACHTGSCPPKCSGYHAISLLLLDPRSLKPHYQTYL